MNLQTILIEPMFRLERSCNKEMEDKKEGGKTRNSGRKAGGLKHPPLQVLSDAGVPGVAAFWGGATLALAEFFYVICGC